MSPDSAAAPAEGDEGRTTRISHEEDAPTTVAPAPDSNEEHAAPAGRVVTVQLPPDTDASELGTTLRVLADVLNPGSRSAEHVEYLARQLLDVDHLAALQAEVEDARQERQRQRMEADRLKAWEAVITEYRRHHNFDVTPYRFEREWRQYLDPATGRPYPLPVRWSSPSSHWQERVDRLAADGVPWRTVRDAIHDTLTGPEQHRTLDTVVRRSRRHMRRLQERAELRLVKGGESG